jgi:superfamily II DNA/RNA helicase
MGAGVMTFPTVIPPLAEALTAHGYTTLTPVQSAVIEPGARSRDLVVSAQTGSGKTVAFGLAIADELLAEGALPPAAAPLALVIAPTRELALQVSRELIWLYAKAGARIASASGAAAGGSAPSASSSSAIARPKATVLPEPVWAETTRSRLRAPGSITALWTGVSVV